MWLLGWEFVWERYKILLKKGKTVVLEDAENIVGKWRKCWIQAFSPFVKMFSKPPQ